MKTKYLVLALFFALVSVSNVKAQYLLQDVFPTLTFNSITECVTAPDAANRML